MQPLERRAIASRLRLQQMLIAESQDILKHQIEELSQQILPIRQAGMNSQIVEVSPGISINLKCLVG